MIDVYRVPEKTRNFSCEAIVADPPFLAVENLTVVRGVKKIVEKISLNLASGSITAVVGPSGVGKSTFLKVLNRILDTEGPAHYFGDVRLENRSIFDRNVDLRLLRRQVGMVFQKPTPFPVSIFKNISIPLKESRSISIKDLEREVELYLSMVGLWSEVKDKLHTPAMALSGGQQQRLCIARAMSLKPSLLLLDEPCSSLDPLSTSVIEELLLDMRRHTTMMIVTHNLAQAKRVADQTALFWPDHGVGFLVEIAQTKDFFQNPKSFYTQRYVDGLSG